ncbi:hypothetical protein IE53DRAFT_10601 [Violaceomyces palustris]|uniref:Uncharacterized protein n=1 Tax=Violaceomyces palustris TaxID=1673888 RepID=A0ACD0P2I1_9BASI|nr:hypothetical protein IE53DRAFT_10601 [Violaceomyces palustris]
MAYVALCKALYDYTAQAEDELSLTEDDTLYILEADDPEWWKAKLRRLNEDGTPVQDQTDEEAESLVGLVPKNYVEEAEPLRLSRALYDYEAQTEDELSITEDELLRVYETDGLWLLVKKQGQDTIGGGEGRLGYVPANYVDEVAAVDTGSAPVTEEEGQQIEDEDEEDDTSVAATPSLPTMIMAPAGIQDKADDIKMWPVSAVDSKKKKKKGTLGIGNASLFFASESDKMPVQKISVLHITAHSIEKGKNLLVELSTEAGVQDNCLRFHSGSKDAAEEIAKKIDDSKGAAQNGNESSSIPNPPPVAAQSASIPLPPPPPPIGGSALPPPTRSSSILPPPMRKTVSFQAAEAQGPDSQEVSGANGHSAIGGDGRGEMAVALYDFEAQGDDELSVAEDEKLTVLEKENDDWWKVRNARGEEGVVPASYVEIQESNSGDDGAAEAASAAAEAQRQKQIEEAEAEAERQRQIKAEATERRRREAEERAFKEEQERARREALKAQPAPKPPKLEQRPSTTEVNRAARNVAIPQNRSAPERPKESGNKSKPAPNKTRVWHDRTGQFKVEAEFLGFNQGKIRLHKLNGVVIEVAVEKMSNPDIQYLEDVTGKKLMPNEDEIASKRREQERLRQASSSDSRRDRDRDRERQRERDREQQKEKEREQRHRQNSSRGPKRNVDWFEFFLAAGVDVDDCTRYAAAFERDKIDETILPDLEAGILRSLGLREGDIIRVVKLIDKKFRSNRSAGQQGRPSAQSQSDIEKQMKADEELARKLQEQETAARRGSTTSPAPPQLFSGPNGSLKNNTRRGRPTPTHKSTSDSVDAASLAAASESLVRSATASPPTRSNTMSPGASRKTATPKPATSGFDDDAWTPRPPSTKPSVSTPAPPTPASPPAPTPPAMSASPAVPAQPPVATPEPSKPAPDPNSALFEKLAAMKPPSASTSPRPGASPSNVGFLGGVGYNPNAPRGPLAPVPSNQGLLQPLIPTQGTGQFVPTRQQPTGMGGMGMNGMQPQQTGLGGMGMNMGMGMGVGMGMGMQSQQNGWSNQGGMQPQMTGFNGMGMGGMGLQNQQTGFGSMQPQQTGFTSGMGTGTGFGMGMSMNSPSPSQFSGQMQPQQTGFPGMTMQSQQTAFGQIPNGSGFGSGSQAVQQQQQQQQSNDADKFNASNIFQQMKTGTFAKDPNSEAQSARKSSPYTCHSPPFPSSLHATFHHEPQTAGLKASVKLT